MAGVLYGAAWAQDVRNRRYAPGVVTGTVCIEDVLAPPGARRRLQPL